MSLKTRIDGLSGEAVESQLTRIMAKYSPGDIEAGLQALDKLNLQPSEPLMLDRLNFSALSGSEGALLVRLVKDLAGILPAFSELPAAQRSEIVNRLRDGMKKS